MLELAKTFVVAAGVLACQAAFADPNYLSAEGAIVRSASGDCVRTGQWTAQAAAPECQPQVEVLFSFDGDELDTASREALDQAARIFNAENVPVTVTGHADALGTQAHNQILSARRLWVVRDYLLMRGVALERFVLQAKGADEPRTGGRCDLAAKDPEAREELIECLQPDRRVEVRSAY